jgi:hypothetical protein
MSDVGYRASPYYSKNTDNLFQAIRDRDLPAISYYSVRSSDAAALRMAVSTGRPDIVAILVYSGFYLDTQNHEGNTVLVSAVKNNRAPIVKLLLDGEADANIQNNKGWTPLMFAAEKGYDEIVKLLIKAGANVNKSTYQGNTPLLFAVKEGHINTVRILVNAGADINYKNMIGESALSIATDKGYTDIVRILNDARVSKASTLPQLSTSTTGPKRTIGTIRSPRPASLSAEASARKTRRNRKGRQYTRRNRR